MDQNDLDILARTLYGEAEAYDVDDAEAIAAVVMNRIRWRNWPNTAAQVCLQPWQFSCWNQNDPNRVRILAVTEDDAWFRTCIGIAKRALDGTLHDKTNGATHYYASYLDDKGLTPKWARGKTPSYTNTSGKYIHYFFNDIDTPPPASAKEALDQERPITETRTVRGAVATGVGGGIVALEGLMPLVDRGMDQVNTGNIIQIAVGVAIIAFAGWIFYARLDDRRQGSR